MVTQDKVSGRKELLKRRGKKMKRMKKMVRRRILWHWRNIAWRN